MQLAVDVNNYFNYDDIHGTHDINSGINHLITLDRKQCMLCLELYTYAFWYKIKSLK